jgi:hypothetical protein
MALDQQRQSNCLWNWKPQILQKGGIVREFTSIKEVLSDGNK